MAATAIMALVAPGLAMAQAPSAGQAGEAATTVGEIVVTAQRRSESLQKVPAAITALSGQDVQARGISDVQGLQFAAPSLAVGSQPGVTMISIRGVGLNQRQGSPAVGVYVDGIYQPRTGLGSITQVDLARVEVLRGPQGTLYGRNTNGGAVSFISNAPSQEFGGYLLVGAKTYEEYRLQGQVNAPLGGGWAVRAVINYDDRNKGFIENVRPGGPDYNYGEVLGGRLRVAGEITDGLHLDLEYAGQQTDGPFDYFTLSNAPTPIAIANARVLANAIVTTEKFRTTGDEFSDTFRQYQVYAATLTWASPLGELKSISSYQRFKDKSRYDADGLSLPFTISAYANRSDTYIQELLLNSNLGPVDTVAGVFLMQDNWNANYRFNFPLGLGLLPPRAHLDVQQRKYRTESWAGYFDGTWRIAPKLRLIGGLRYSVDEVNVVSASPLSLITPVGLAPIGTLCPLRQDRERFESFTPRAGAQYDISDDVNVYGTASRGFKAGGFNVSGCGNKYGPEKITAYELGFKSRLLDHSLVFNVAAFYYDYADLQVDQIVNLQQRITNAAAATVKGMEVETLYAPDRHWILNANVSYLDATYGDFSNIDTLNPLAGLQNVRGRRLNYSPKWSLNAGAAYTTDKTALGAVQARADVSYRSTFYFRPYNAPLDSQPAYTLVNLSLLWTAPKEDYSVRLFVNNVANTGYRTMQGANEGVGARFGAWGAPRQLGVELRADF